MKELKFLGFDPSKFVNKTYGLAYHEIEYEDPKTFAHEFVDVDTEMCSIAGKIAAQKQKENGYYYFEKNRNPSKAGKASIAKRRKNRLPIGFDGWDKEKLRLMCIEAGKITTNKESKWWFNGVDYKFVKEQPGNEWIISNAPNNPGKLTSNTKWWNNGIKHKRCISCPGKGWIEGRINKGNLGGARIQTPEANLKRSIAMKKYRSSLVNK